MELPEFVVSLYQASDQTIKYNPPCWQNFVDHLNGANTTTFSDQLVEQALEKYNAIYYRRAAYETLKGHEVLTTAPYVIFNTMEDMMEFMLSWS